MSKRLLGLAFILVIAAGFFVAAPNLAQANSCSHPGTQTVPKHDSNGNPVLNDDGTPQTETITVDIADPCITNFSVTATGYDTDNTTPYAQSPAKYVISFQVKNATLTSGSVINVEFPSQFDLSAETDKTNLSSNTGVISFLPPTTIQVTVGSPVTSDSTINITVENVINGEAGVEYPISVSSGNLSDSGSVKFDEAPAQESSGQEDCGAWYHIFCHIKNGITAAFDGVVAIIAGIIGTVLNAIGGVFLTMAADLTKFVLGLTTKSFQSNGSYISAAQFGFNTTLAIADVGFVIGIIVIAFATIFRRTSYGLQKALPRLILIAVLINFSFFIASTVIDVSNAITNVFLEKVSKSIQFTAPSIGDNYAALRGDGATGGGAVLLLIKPFLQLGFDIIASFALLALAIMFIIRYVALAILLTLLPFVLVLWVFPNLNVGGTGNAWEKWFGEFTKWIIFGPVTMLFVYIAFSIEDVPGDAGGGFITMVIKLGILIGGILVANSLGLKGAGFANKMAGMGARRAAGLVGRTAVGTGSMLKGSISKYRAESKKDFVGPSRGFGTILAGEFKQTQVGKAAVKVGGVAAGGVKAVKDSRAQAKVDQQTYEQQQAAYLAGQGPKPEKPKGALGALAGKAWEGTEGAREKFGEKVHEKVHAVEHGFEHWATGGPKLKGTLKGGWTELKSSFGNLEHGPMEPLLGHTKEEGLQLKSDKLEKIMKKTSEEELEALKKIGWNEERIAKFYEAKPEEQLRMQREEIKPNMSKEEYDGYMKVFHTKAAVKREQAGVYNQIIREEAGLNEAAHGAAHAAPAAKKAPASGGAHH